MAHGYESSYPSHGKFVSQCASEVLPRYTQYAHLE